MQKLADDFLLEIGCEEMPADTLLFLAKELAKNLEKEIKAAQLTYQSIQSYATPRRLAVIVSNLATSQPQLKSEKIGPSYNAAYDKEGNPTSACIGFARSCGVSVEQIKIKEFPKDKKIYCEINQPGEKTIKLLSQIVTLALKKIPLVKPMRWGNYETLFIRPVHWVVMLYGQDVVESTILGLPATRETQGHRFLYPFSISLNQPKDYDLTLSSQGFVIVDFNTRKELIRKQIINTTNPQDHAIIDENLLEEVTGLVEWPVALKGRFAEKFLTVPKEVLITSMQTHQKCFAVENAQEKLEPYFILISNIKSKNVTTVVQGNEKVINARLSDAEFFYQQDIKHSLESRYDRLKDVVFQKELGSIAEKSKRISKLAASVANLININAEYAARSGKLAKCDLMSEMVFEFPTLQGIMGYYYALHDKEPELVAMAVRDQYLPRFSGDKLPEDLYGSVIALSDRLDTLVGILGINQAPTGEKDPFALRRAAQGIFRILIEKELPLDLKELLHQAYANYEISLPNKNVVEQAYAFIIGRLKSWYYERNVSAETFEAVLARNPTKPFDFHRRIQAVLQFQTLPEASALAAANKRVSNILKKIDTESLPKTNPALYEFDEERKLSELLTTQSKIVTEFYQNSDYTKALCSLSTLKTPIDSFFDRVMVMVEDEKIRNNRLALLLPLRELFTHVADISLLST